MSNPDNPIHSEALAAARLTPLERAKFFREGEDANDHNHRVYRTARGTTKGNPYEVNSEEWKAWRDGYAYRDMVNDG